ncbi:hypothetical protein [Paucilactobacillus nenjiangensis]|uniref:hypothetical protein n=1 Tax=Paucilactobacillus nenjiangensis TaxID=1296540 RepID=UPI0010F7C972|nr:hypothetical protein [Paucilactobacillus nenjiangensis]
MKKLSVRKPSINLGNFDLTIIVHAVLIGIITPLLTEYMPIVKVRLIGVPILLMLINFIYAAILGLWIQKHESNGLQILIFPLVFSILAYLILPKYMYYFGPIYLLISYLAWSMSRPKE